MKFKYDNLIFPFFQQRPRYIQGVSRTDIPIAANVESVNPDNPFYSRETQEGIRMIGPAIEVLAANEYLDAHKNAVSVRLALNPQNKL